MLILSVSIVKAQQTFDIGSATLWSDTLISLSDTIDYIPLNYAYEWLNITAIDTGSVQTDTIVVEYPTHNYTRKTSSGRSRWEISDTTWTAVHFMRDSTWTNVNIIAAAASVTSYKIHVADYKEVRIRMANTVTVASKNWWFKAQGVYKY